MSIGHVRLQNGQNAEYQEGYMVIVLALEAFVPDRLGSCTFSKPSSLLIHGNFSHDNRALLRRGSVG
jgi:hypothetical protein